MNDPAPAAAMCPRHPDQPAAGVCTRCGGFFCSADVVRFDDKPFCPSCAALPEVDYLEAFRLKYWGRRDGWAWVFGLGALGNLVLAVVAVVAKNPLFVVYALLGMAVGVGFWLGMRWARVGMAAVVALGIVVNVSLMGPAGASSMIVPILFVISVYQDTRNRLFFKIDVSRERLQKAWNLYCNNSIARAGFIMGVLALLFGPVAVIGLPCSIVGLRRVDPQAHPPIGRRGQAIAGIVLNSVGLAVLAVVGVFWGLT